MKVNKPKRLTGLSQQARSQVGSCRMAQRERRTAGVKSEPKSSPWDCCGTWKSCPARPARAGQTLPQGGSGAAALGGPKKPKPAVMRWICPRRSGLNWQERMGNRNSKSGKQMTTGACRLMRPEVRAPSGTTRCGHLSVLPSRLALIRSGGGSTSNFGWAL